MIFTRLIKRKGFLTFMEFLPNLEKPQKIKIKAVKFKLKERLW